MKTYKKETFNKIKKARQHGNNRSKGDSYQQF